MLLARFIVTHGVDLAVSQGAIMVMRDDGAVLAMVGGANYSASQFNRAVQARRQPGSAFKPILYASALEQGWLPEDMILDAPFRQMSMTTPRATLMMNTQGRSR